MNHFCGLRNILLQEVVNVVRIGMPVYVGPPLRPVTTHPEPAPAINLT